MPREIHYAELAESREEQDELALRDLKEWLDPEQWVKLVAFATTSWEAKNVHLINMSLAIAGVSGAPFHAFCRKYCLEAYRAWMHEGEDAVLTDEQGFRLGE